MKALLVTSRVTFVPQNYACFVEGLAAHPNIAGVLFLENRDAKTFAMGAAFWASRLASGIGHHLMTNSVRSFTDPRARAFSHAGKAVHSQKTINCAEAIEILRGYDLVVNARTRFIYRDEALAAPRIGCINIHHGLLPDQRGVFCDLWAMAQGRPAGFTIHRMTKKLDDGEILESREVPSPFGQNFVAHTLHSAGEELRAMSDVLDRIALTQQIAGRPNTRTPQTRFYKNPMVDDLRRFRREGFSV